MPRKHAKAPAVGHLVHELCGNWAVIRRKANENKTLYGMCAFCGELGCTNARGQELYLDDRHAGAKLWGPEGAPKFLPLWIRENLAVREPGPELMVQADGTQAPPPASRAFPRKPAPAAEAPKPEPKAPPAKPAPAAEPHKPEPKVPAPAANPEPVKRRGFLDEIFGDGE